MCLHCGQCRIIPRFTNKLIPHVIRCPNPAARLWPARLSPGIVHVRQSRQPAITSPSRSRATGYARAAWPSPACTGPGLDRNTPVTDGHTGGEEVIPCPADNADSRQGPSGGPCLRRESRSPEGGRIGTSEAPRTGRYRVARASDAAEPREPPPTYSPSPFEPRPLQYLSTSRPRHSHGRP